MAKSRNTRKKKRPQPTSSRKERQSRDIPPSTPKQKMLVGVLLVAMLLFVGGGLIKTFMGNTGPNSTEIVEPQFRKDGELSFIKAATGENISKIEVEIVESIPLINQGLMYRKSMEEFRGMLFKMPIEEPQAFWMKNTHIPLDIIFVNSDKEIVTIHKDTTPFSEASLPSKKSAKYVVEVNAGYCDRNSINVGDKIRF